jgi:L-alanine-DL-glutamate epimerase-like enolase superfamily enzyme
MMCTLTVRKEVWPLARPFTISRGTKTAAEVVVAEVSSERGGRRLVGRGECVPYPRYRESVEGVVAALRAEANAVANGLDRDGLLEKMPAGAARNALDCALWDFESKETGMPVWRRAGVAEPKAAVTAETIALGPPDAMAAAARALQDRPLLKLKLGAEAVVSSVSAVRQAAPLARLIVDANEGWTLDLLKQVTPELANLKVAMIEQPLPAGADAVLAEFASPVPLCADESCHDVGDLGRLGGYRVVNVKLDKAGGLTAALALARAAREAGFSVMVGCMVGTSLAMAPAMVLAGLADVLDLDGPLWLASDRASPLRFERGIVYPPDPDLWG